MADSRRAASLERRLGGLRALLKQENLDALVVNHSLNRRYLSGIPARDPQPGETPGWLIISQEAAIALITSSNYGEAVSQAPHFDVRSLQAPIYPIVGENAGRLIAGENWHRIGFEGDAMTYNWYRDIKGAMAAGQELISTRGLVEQVRGVKDEYELAVMRKAAQISSAAFNEVMASVGPGITELELAWAIERTAREMGAEGMAFDTIVAAGAGAAIPHHETSDRKIERNEPVLIDMGASVEGYAADMTRTFCFGRADARLREIHQLMEATLAATVDRIEAGVTGEYVCAGWVETLRNSPYHDPKSKGGGHGIGLAVHETPNLGPTHMRLFPGMVFAIEPAVYLSDWGGVRLEDTVLVRAKDGQRLTNATFQLEF